MSKWILIEVDNQSINEPDTYNSYIEAYTKMGNRYNDLKTDDAECSIHEYYASIQSDYNNVDWRIYEVEME